MKFIQKDLFNDFKKIISSDEPDIIKFLQYMSKVKQKVNAWRMPEKEDLTHGNIDYKEGYNSAYKNANDAFDLIFDIEI
jgi:hypothetical protein